MTDRLGGHRSTGRHAIGRRQFLGGLVALAGSGAIAAGLAEGLGDGPSVASPHVDDTVLLQNEPKLKSRASPLIEKGPFARTFVTRPDLAPPKVVIAANHAGQDDALIATDAHPGVGQCGALLMQPDGETAWFRPLGHTATGGHAFNVRVQRYRGKPVLTYFDGVIYEAHGVGTYRILDTHYRTIATVRGKGLHGDEHEFLITPWDTAVFTTYGHTTADLTSLGGTADQPYLFCELQEVDIATNKLLFSWRSDHYVPFTESMGQPNPDGAWWDYFHMNSIGVDPSDGNYIVSSRVCWAAYKIDRHTGAIIWRLGGRKSDFAMGPGAAFKWQHDVTPLGNGLFTIFDNHPPPGTTRALTLQLDEKKMTATMVRQIIHNPVLTSPVLGSVQSLPNGHTFVGWGTTGWFTEYGPKNEVLLDGHLEGTGLYRAFKVDWDAVPAEAPAVVAKATRRGAAAVYVSWNGATTVKHWRVLAGAKRDELHPIGVARRRGFETVIELPSSPSYVQLEALDEKRRLLRHSRVTRLV